MLNQLFVISGVNSYCRFGMMTMQNPGRNTFVGYKHSDTKRNAYELASASRVRMPTIILVNPFLDANVGSVARAMLNFGVSELRIVDPICNIHSDAAKALSAGAYQIIENAKIFATVEDSISDLKRVMATSVRPRDMTQIVYTPAAAAKEALSADAIASNSSFVGILFGRETNGLNNHEMSLADSIIHIPTFSSFSSLNLAQAVNVVSYELWKKRLEIDGGEKDTVKALSPPEVWLHPRDGERIAKREEVDNYLRRLESSLLNRDFQSDENRRRLLFRYLRNIYQRVSPYCAHLVFLLLVVQEYIFLFDIHLLPPVNKLTSSPALILFLILTISFMKSSEDKFKTGRLDPNPNSFLCTLSCRCC